MIFKMGFGLLAAVSLVCPAGAALPGTKTLSGHVPAVVTGLAAKGRLPATNHLSLAIGLPLRNSEALTNLLAQIYDPASPNYHHFLSPAEFTAQFGPTAQDYQAVADFAQTHGLTVTGTHPNRMVLDVNGQVTNIESAFNISLHTYAHPKEARDFYAPDTEPSVATNLPVLHVSGLDNYVVPHSLLKKLATASGSPKLGSSPGGGYIGTDFRNAYVPGTSLNGAGQMVGLLQFDSGFYQSDITTYEAQAGITNNTPVQAVLLDGYGGGPGFANDEVSLDIEMVISMAPAVSKIYVFEGSLTDDILSAMASSNLVKQLSASWSYPIDRTSEQLFQQFAAQGQSFFNASGDSDAWLTGQIPTPCDDPHITIVGGTTLSTTTANGPWSSETVWNWGIEYGVDGIGGGGGISTTYRIPTWQTNINMTTNQGSTTFRNIPDVALTADNVFVEFGGGQNGLFGGTSCATPLWAAYMALVNQQATANGNVSLGFLNPAIYPMLQSANYNSLFHDITTGNNTWSQSPNLFYAVPGYDLCTGLGTPNGTNLINALAGISNTVLQVSAPSSPYGTNLATLIGGNPNGVWTLFVQDDTPLNIGVISNGWSVTLTLGSPVGQAANLNLSVTAPTNFVPVGSNVVYVIGVTNDGPSASVNPVLSDTLPDGVTLVSSNLSQGVLTSSGSTLVWTIPTLATNAGAQLMLTVLPDGAGTFVNSAFVTATTPDPNADDNYVATSVVVGSGAPPQLSGSYSSNGSQFTFSISDASLEPYVVQASTNLANPFGWVPIYTNPAPATTTTMFTDSSATNHPYRFFRVLLQ
jgi:uncharacterized repeat protein (TIGR01451 family)